MMRSLVDKLLRDVRLPLAVVVVLLAGYQCLWAKITERVDDLLKQLVPIAATAGVTPQEILDEVFKGPGKIMQKLMGGEGINIFHIDNAITIGYVHPVMLTVFCIWAIGRAAGAITGEIDRGTMELLLAQPVARFRVVLAHLCVDAVTIPILCLSLWGGNWLGIWLVGLKQLDAAKFGPALWNVGALIFAISGYTMWLSARGRFRGRVLGAAVLITLLQFLINVVGQLWEDVARLRPFTVFYYYQPQQIILDHKWSANLAVTWNGEQQVLVNVLAILFTVGCAGYAMAFWTFCRRDLPAPL
jgi:ABC-2 type transport system permease protein